MRDREIIEKDHLRILENGRASTNWILMEILLDIRDLLKDCRKVKRKETKQT